MILVCTIPVRHVREWNISYYIVLSDYEKVFMTPQGTDGMVEVMIVDSLELVLLLSRSACG